MEKSKNTLYLQPFITRVIYECPNGEESTRDYGIGQAILAVALCDFCRGIAVKKEVAFIAPEEPPKNTN